MMKQIKRMITGLKDRLEDILKELCGEITPDRRITVILVILAAFTFLNVYVTYRAIYDKGKERGRTEQLAERIVREHVKSLDAERLKPYKNNLNNQ